MSSWLEQRRWTYWPSLGWTTSMSSLTYILCDNIWDGWLMNSYIKSSSSHTSIKLLPSSSFVLRVVKQRDYWGTAQLGLAWSFVWQKWIISHPFLINDNGKLLIIIQLYFNNFMPIGCVGYLSELKRWFLLPVLTSWWRRLGDGR